MIWLIIIAILIVGYYIVEAIQRNTQANVQIAQQQLQQQEANRVLTIDEQIEQLKRRTKEKEIDILRDRKWVLKEDEEEIAHRRSDKNFNVNFFLQEKIKREKEDLSVFHKWINVNTMLCERYRHNKTELLKQLNDWNTWFDVFRDGNDEEEQQYWQGIAIGKNISPNEDELQIRSLEARTRILERLKQEKFEQKFRLEMEKALSLVRVQTEK